MLIGEATAERIKIQIGTAFPGPEVQEIDVVGRHLAAGVPRNFTMNSNEILDALQEPLRSEEHTSELQSLMRISYAVFCLKKKKHKTIIRNKKKHKKNYNMK